MKSQILLLTLIRALSLTACNKSPTSPSDVSDISEPSSSISREESSSQISTDGEKADGKDNKVFKNESMAKVECGFSEEEATRLSHDYVTYTNKDETYKTLQSDEWFAEMLNKGESGTLLGLHMYNNRGVDGLMLSGAGYISTTGGEPDFTDFFRETEYPYKRIRVFSNDYDLEYFKSNFEKGQRILKGEDASEGAVIIDGVYVPDATFYIDSDGMCYFDALPVLQTFTETVTNDPEYKIMFQYDCYKSGGDYARILTDMTPVTAYKSVGLNPQDPYVTPKVKRLDKEYDVGFAKNGKISAKDALIIMGWECYTDGKILSIVSDESNITDTAFIYDFGSGDGLYRRTSLEGGNNVTRVYNHYDRLVATETYSE